MLLQRTDPVFDRQLPSWQAREVTKVLCPACLKEDDASKPTLRRLNSGTYRCPYCQKAYTPESFGEALSELLSEYVRITNMDADAYSELQDLRAFYNATMAAGRKVPEKE
jgi:ribosomal protein L37AE/L43A